MKLLRSNATMLASIALLAGCTQEQQSSISSSDWQRNLNEAFDGVDETLQRTGNWLETESKLSSLKSNISRALDSDSVTPSQAASLKNSLNYIERLQQRSIASGTGIDSSEKAQIDSAINRVDERLESWLAAESQPSM